MKLACHPLWILPKDLAFRISRPEQCYITLIGTGRMIMCHLFEKWAQGGNSRVVGERCLQVLGQPLEVVPKFLELAVGHRRLRTRHGRGTEHTGHRGRSRGRPWRPGGDLLSSTYPQETYGVRRCRWRRRRRRLDVVARTRRKPLLIPAWRASRACSSARVDGGRGWLLAARARERGR